MQPFKQFDVTDRDAKNLIRKARLAQAALPKNDGARSVDAKSVYELQNLLFTTRKS
jgi:hypothetical protein